MTTLRAIIVVEYPSEPMSFGHPISTDELVELDQHDADAGTLSAEDILAIGIVVGITIEDTE